MKIDLPDAAIHNARRYRQLNAEHYMLQSQWQRSEERPFGGATPQESARSFAIAQEMRLLAVALAWAVVTGIAEQAGA
jgi:hypothetical protein